MISAQLPGSAAGQYREIDVTGWTAAGDELLGTKPKRWLREPETNGRWLIKYSTYSRSGDGTSYRKGDDWSERVANGVATQLGVPVARTELAVDETGAELRHGVISKSVLRERSDGSIEEDLVDGNQLLPVPVSGSGREGYTVASVRAALTDVETPDGVGGALTAWQVFVGYLVLDAVIGNADRHEENWAVISSAGRRRLAPSFDHASCLGFQLDDGHRERRLTTRDKGYTPEAYADRAKTPFAGQPHPVEAVAQALVMPETGSNLPWLGRCADVDALVRPIWAIPEARMSVAAREFAERVLTRNCQRLLDDLA